ncbi:hypothetical protein H0264_35630 [Nocardia huaxiensis]|uniref:Uncharacterized protein n=1 Tax=Nocardia huaxiensis TaxID=2755382 RepID=A0A7D6VDQ0_9NOCA|nr:hypothetical protein [Nocardia huaxiensis]QLY30397.1 hypothetical protein H0264_35630 [Nocardia huaxiensis]
MMAPLTLLAARFAARTLSRSRLVRTVVMASIFLAVMLVVGCGASTGPVSLSDGKQIADACPSGRSVAGRAAIDVSTHMRPIAADAGRLDPVRQQVRRTLICGGHLRVEVFSGSSASTAAVYDGELKLPGATENARLRREPAMTEDIMAEIRRNLPDAAATLPLTGSDITAQFGMSAEYLAQLSPYGSRFMLDMLVVTDGVQSEGFDLTDPALTPERAKVLAGQVTVPELPGAVVQFTSIGKTANPAPPTAYVDGLKVFFTEVCMATGAARCTVVTDAAGR